MSAIFFSIFITFFFYHLHQDKKITKLEVVEVHTTDRAVDSTRFAPQQTRRVFVNRNE